MLRDVAWDEVRLQFLFHYKDGDNLVLIFQTVAGLYGANMTIRLLDEKIWICCLTSLVVAPGQQW